MDTLLDALQEGRLFELPENDKSHALQFLAHIIEAFPETPAGTDVVESVMKREQVATTAIGKGWACPHARIPGDEDLMCVVGWSPAGIDYGSPDGAPVSLVVMYLVPDNQRNHYLREISSLAKAIESYSGGEKLREATDLDDIRGYLLDLIETGEKTVVPDTRARMIRLQTRPAREAAAVQDLSNLIVEPVTIIAGPGMNHVVLAQNPVLFEQLRSVNGLAERLDAGGVFQNGGWRVLKRSSTLYQGGRVAHDCLAIRMAPQTSARQA